MSRLEGSRAAGPPGRVAPDADGRACVPGPAGHCSVCGDEGWVGTVVAVADGGSEARVRPEGEAGVEVALDLVDGVAAGDRVVVHMGFAIATVRDGEASADAAGSAPPTPGGAPAGPPPGGGEAGPARGGTR